MYPFLTGTSRINGSTVFLGWICRRGTIRFPWPPRTFFKTAVITSSRMLKFLCLPFGLRKAGNMFQRMMDQILGNLPYCFVYINDILAWGNVSLWFRRLSSWVIASIILVSSPSLSTPPPSEVFLPPQINLDFSVFSV